MKIKCEWIVTNRKGFGSRYQSLNAKQLMQTMRENLDKITAVIEKYADTKISIGTPREVKWDKRGGEPAHEDVRVDFYISKKGRSGIKEREAYEEVNKIQTAYFTKIR